VLQLIQHAERLHYHLAHYIFASKFGSQNIHPITTDRTGHGLRRTSPSNALGSRHVTTFTKSHRWPW